MYERPDVPKGGPHRNLIAGIVIAVVAVALVVLVMTLWRLANEHTKLGDSDLSDVVTASTVSADDISAHAATADATPTNADITTVMFAVTSDDGETLAALYLAVLNETDNTAKLVGIPADARLQGTSTAFSGVFAKDGAAGVVSELAGVAVPVSHVVVMTSDGWDAFMAVAEQGSSALTRNATKLLEGITKSDMDSQELMDIGKRAASSGVSAGGIGQVPVSDATADDGTAYQQVSSADLGRAIGTLA